MSQVPYITGEVNPVLGDSIVIKSTGAAGIITSIDKYVGDALTTVSWAAGVQDLSTMQENNMAIYYNQANSTWYAIPYTENRLPDLEGTIRGL